MIIAAKSLFPSADLRVIDARDLRLDDRFDCVMFSFNGIDSVAYSDRETIIRQIATVLRPGGYLIYSTHNVHFPRASIWLNRLFVKELVQAWPRIHVVARSFVNRLRMYWQQSCDEEVPFAVVNDVAAEFGYLNVYVDIPQEVETTLRRGGFNVVATIGNTRQTPGFGSEDNWVYIVAQLIAEA